MGIKVTREFALEQGDKTIVFNPEVDKIAESRAIGLICDSPRCAARHGGKTTFLTWDEVQAEKDPASLPPGFSDIIKIYPDPLNAEYAVYVCSVSCAKDYLTYGYVPAKTPQQRLAELKVNPAAQQAIDAQNQIPLPFPEEAAQSIEQNAELLQMLADSDATGVK